MVKLMGTNSPDRVRNCKPGELHAEHRVASFKWLNVKLPLSQATRVKRAKSKDILPAVSVKPLRPPPVNKLDEASDMIQLAIQGDNISVVLALNGVYKFSINTCNEIRVALTTLSTLAYYGLVGPSCKTSMWGDHLPRRFNELADALAGRGAHGESFVSPLASFRDLSFFQAPGSV